MTLHQLDAGFYGYMSVCLINQLVPSGLLWVGSLHIFYQLICQSARLDDKQALVFFIVLKFRTN